MKVGGPRVVSGSTTSCKGVLQSSCNSLPCASRSRFEAQLCKELNTFRDVFNARMNFARAGGAPNTSEKLKRSWQVEEIM